MHNDVNIQYTLSARLKTVNKPRFWSPKINWVYDSASGITEQHTFLITLLFLLFVHFHNRLLPKSPGRPWIAAEGQSKSFMRVDPMPGGWICQSECQSSASDCECCGQATWYLISWSSGCIVFPWSAVCYFLFNCRLSCDRVSVASWLRK